MHILPFGTSETFALKLMRPENHRRGSDYLNLAKDAYDASLDPNRYWVMDIKNSPEFRAEGPKIFRNWEVADVVRHFLPEDFRMVARFERKRQLLEVWLAFRGTSNAVEAGHCVPSLAVSHDMRDVGSVSDPFVILPMRSGSDGSGCGTGPTIPRLPPCLD